MILSGCERYDWIVCVYVFLFILFVCLFVLKFAFVMSVLIQ
jgi:hypothetical protein